MKCSKCGDAPDTVGQLRRCAGCDDGTAQQVPADLPDEAPIEDAVRMREGLGNRFKAAAPAADPAPAAAAPDQAQIAKDTPPEGQKDGIVAKAKRAYTKAMKKK